VRHGRGFTYRDECGQRVTRREVLARPRAGVPPAWSDVWIYTDPLGHLQATGVDSAGRKQYLYHRPWRERRERAKFDRMIRFAEGSRGCGAASPSNWRAPSPVASACSRARCACWTWACSGSVAKSMQRTAAGLGSRRCREPVTFANGSALFDYPAKGGVRRVHALDDPVCVELVRTLMRRRGGAPELLAYRAGPGWMGVPSDDVNDYLKRRLGEEFSAKDFRTWNATVLAAVAHAACHGDPRAKTARRRVIKEAIGGVAVVLGNTPAVARRAYIDPRVFDRFLSGWTIAAALQRIGEPSPVDQRGRRRLERAVLDLLQGDFESPAISRAGPG
jgi:DNA topoisomerase-1